jgi:class 3 adenylate cyclase/tetratricopeptide (TPR) repeat protein
LTPAPGTIRVCATCAAPSAPGQKFCGNCGTALRSDTPTSGPAYEPPPSDGSANADPASERKLVTVLFADMKGSMEILASRDAEDANRILDGCLHRMMNAVHHYKGTVSQARGDGIMALFGAPRAMEDHAVRACLAALRIQTLIAEFAKETKRTDGIDVLVRIGIHSGAVVVRAMRNDLYTEYSAVGHTTHLAARIEQLAAPGTILTTAETARMVQGHVDLEPVGRFPVKGLAEHVDVSRVVRATEGRSRGRPSGTGNAAPFLGRSQEVWELAEAFQATASGIGRTVAVQGDAGIGKSRLIEEGLGQMRRAGAQIASAFTSGIGDMAPYRPIVDLILGLAQIDAATPPPGLGVRFIEWCEARGVSAQSECPAILALLGCLPPDHRFHDLEAEQRRAATISSIVLLIDNLAAREHLVLVVEDLQWADSSTMAVLDSLVRALAARPVLLLTSHRNPCALPWASLAQHRTLDLKPLPPESAVILSSRLLGDDPSRKQLRDALLERAGGNPFFLEQLARAHVAGGLNVMAVPATIQALISARVDRLTTEQKRILQVAAVIGTTAPVSAIAALSRSAPHALMSALHSLDEADFLHETRQVPALEYSFRHALTHEVVYEGMLRETRRDLHARMADILEASQPAEVGTGLAEKVSRHAFFGQLWDKALRYSRLAANSAAERLSFKEAVEMLDRALAAAKFLEKTPDVVRAAIDVRFEMRNALQPLGSRERIGELLAEAQKMAGDIGDRRRQGWAKSYLADHHWIRGQGAQAEAFGAEALGVADEIGDVELAVVTRLPLGLLFHARGHYRKAIAHFDWVAGATQAVHRRARFGLFVLPSVFSRAFMGWSLAELGQFRQAIPVARSAMEIADEAGHPISRGYALLGLGLVDLRRGDVAEAIPAFEGALADETFASSEVGVNFVTLHLGHALSLNGRVSEGIAMLEEATAAAQRRGFMVRHALRLAYLADAYARAGRLDAASSTCRKALEIGTSQGEDANVAFAHVVQGRIALGAGDWSRAIETFAQGRERAKVLELKVLELQCLEGESIARRQTGKCETAAALADAAEALARNLGVETSGHAARE